VRLIQRLYDVSGGAIRLTGRMCAPVEQSSLRARIAVVPLRTRRCSTLDRDNIAYGAPEAAYEEHRRRGQPGAGACLYLEALEGLSHLVASAA